LTAAESIAVRVADALHECGVPYVLTGSFASNYHGIPRSTKDADFVVQLQGALGDDFVARMGDEFDPQLSFETNTGTYRQLMGHAPQAKRVQG
jgi:hypothetical protein